MINRLYRHSAVALGIAALFSGCATVPADRGLTDVSALITARDGLPLSSLPDEGTEAQTMVEELLGQQLSLEAALRIAWVHNPRIRAEYARLGIVGADVLQAGRLSNPTFSAAFLQSDVGGDANQVTFGLAQSFTDLLLLPSRSRLAKGEFERAKTQAGGAVMALTRDVEFAYYMLVGTQQVAVMRSTVARSSTASADLAQRFFDAGNIADLALSVEKAASAQAELNALSAQIAVAEARSSLNKLMGLPASETRWHVGSELRLPVAQEDDLSALQSLAEQQRLDLVAARQEVALLQDALDVTKTYRFLGSAEVGIETERETDRSRITGPTLALQLPIFNQSQGGVLRAQSLVELAEADLESLKIDVSNDVALAYAKVGTTRRSVELLGERLIPLRERIVARTQEQVNYMLVGVFDLIRTKQDEYDTYQMYLEALRDYWLARTALTLAVGAPLPSSAVISDQSAAPELPDQIRETGHSHH